MTIQVRRWRQITCEILGYLDSALFPEESLCPLCGRAGDFAWLCPECSNEVFFCQEQDFCRICGKIVERVKESVQLCRECELGRSYPFVLARAVGSYQGVFKEAVYQLKYTGRQTLAQTMGKLMSSVIMRDLRYRNVQMIIPVPLAIERLRERGFNQAELLAQEISRVLSVQLSTVLGRQKSTASQAKLSRKLRLEQMRNAFCVTYPEVVSGKSLLLVDDVFTTGSTVSEAANALMTAGAAEVLVITWATGFLDNNN